VLDNRSDVSYTKGMTTTPVTSHNAACLGHLDTIVADNMPAEAADLDSVSFQAEVDRRVAERLVDGICYCHEEN